MVYPFLPMFFFCFTSFTTARLQQMLNKPSSHELGQNDVRALIMLILIVALLAENCNFDDLRKEHPSMTAVSVNLPVLIVV